MTNTERSKAHLRAPEIRQVRERCTSLEVNLEVHRREVGSRTPLEKRLSLPRKIRAILRTVGRRTNVDDAGVLAPLVLVCHGMADIGVPEDRVAGHDLRYRDQ